MKLFFVTAKKRVENSLSLVLDNFLLEMRRHAPSLKALFQPLKMQSKNSLNHGAPCNVFFEKSEEIIHVHFFKSLEYFW